MTQVKWLLQTDVFLENIDGLREEIERQGMECRMVKYLPFGATSREYLSWFKPEDCVVFYGTINMASEVSRESSWTPGVYATFKEFQCTSYLHHLGRFLLNADYSMFPFGDLKRLKSTICSRHGRGGKVFMRPNTGMKSFGGQVIAFDDWERDLDRMSVGAFPADLVLVSDPKDVRDEWRFVVVGGKVVTGSQYIVNEEVESVADYPEEAFKLAEEVASSGYQPESCWTLDICRTGDGEYRLLEINSFSCSGLYACNLKAIVEAVSEQARKDWEDVYGT